MISELNCSAQAASASSARRSLVGARSTRASRFRPARECPFKSSGLFRERLEFLTGEKIDTRHWDKDYPLDADGYPAGYVPAESRSCWWNCCFQDRVLQGQLGSEVQAEAGLEDGA